VELQRHGRQEDAGQGGTVGFGLIGLGHHGIRYARHLAADVPGVRLAAVCRRDRTRGEAVARELGARFYDDYRRLLEDCEVEAVVIVSPTGSHRDMALAAAESGRAILLEKPIAPTTPEADEILDAVSARAVPLMVAHTLRFEPTAEAFAAALPQVGRVRALNLQHRSRDIRMTQDADPEAADCRGVVLDTGVHYFDLIRWFFPSGLDTVRCEIRRHDRRRSEDAFAALISGPDLLVTVDVCRATPARQESWVAVGERGILTADRFGNTLSLVTPDGTHRLPSPEPAPTLPRVVRSFVRSITTGTPIEVPGRPAREAVAMAEACIRSAEAGRAVRL